MGAPRGNDFSSAPLGLGALCSTRAESLVLESHRTDPLGLWQSAIGLLQKTYKTVNGALHHTHASHIPCASSHTHTHTTGSLSLSHTHTLCGERCRADQHCAVNSDTVEFERLPGVSDSLALQVGISTALQWRNTDPPESVCVVVVGGFFVWFFVVVVFVAVDGFDA